MQAKTIVFSPQGYQFPEYVAYDSREETDCSSAEVSPMPTPVKKLKFACESPKATPRRFDDCLFDQAPVKECTYLQNPKLFSNRERMCTFNQEA